MKPEDMPAWCFLTGQFLLRFDKKKRYSHYSEVHNDFLKSTETDPPLSDFLYINPAVVIMLCYGLLVYPVEYWNTFLKDELSVKRLNEGIVAAAQHMGVSVTTFIELFSVKLWKSSTSEPNFIRKLRNAIAHSHIKVDMEHNLYTFWNINKNNEIDFEILASTENIGIFLTGLGRHFSNTQRHIR
ncbi:MAG: hypothetical protein HZA00_03025 [Nitrospinae bacterium]|nr:hypothetical protein [Nitrospinota bacterium]